MKASVLLCLLCLGNIQVRGDDANHPIQSASAQQAPDLDFTDENAKPNPIRPTANPVTVTRPWLYWSLGFSAAAGGMTYFLWDMGKSSAPTKTVQVFTDAPN